MGEELHVDLGSSCTFEALATQQRFQTRSANPELGEACASQAFFPFPINLDHSEIAK